MLVYLLEWFIVAMFLLASVALVIATRRAGGKRPLGFWQFTTLQIGILLTIGTFLFWLLRLCYLDWRG